jgi:S-formylglutathione hydrolase
VFDPPGCRGAVLLLHPVSGPVTPDWPPLTAALNEHRLGCVAPHGGRTWWLGPAESHLTDVVLPWVRATWGRSVAVLGIEAGGQAAVRLGFRRPDLVPVVGSLGGAFDFHRWHGRGTGLDDVYPTADAARQDTAVLHLDPQRFPPHVRFDCDPADGWWPGNDRLREKLTAYGLPHQCDLDTSAADPWAYFDRQIGPLVGWAADALSAAGRRLL